MLLKGQTALVTGANSGIGKAIAKAMAAAGANVGVNYIANKEAADQIVSEIAQSGGKAIAVEADVSREEQVTKMFDTLVEAFGHVDILVSNAGIQQDSPFEKMTLDQWNKVISVNLTGAFLCARQAVRIFLKQGIVPERSVAAGKILFTSSVHQAIPWAHHSNYATSKGGMVMLMKTIAQEMGPQRIRANNLAPGAIKTPINKKAWETEDEKASLRKLIPYGRIGETTDIAPAAVWLASDQADYITGTTLYVDGGMMLYPGFRTGG